MNGEVAAQNLFGKNAKEAQKYFLENYWQKRPLLIRGAFPAGLSHVDPDSLAGLSCQAGIDSRIVMEHGPDYPWQTRQGPFEEDVFESLPKTHWTLLVQAVDRLVPEVAEVLEKFRFLPNWRLDDIMISYAADHGSVGPHTDNYDVFLIQAMGKRKWDYSSLPMTVIEFEEGLDLKILKNFKADESFVLDEGDLLYLPPHVGHHGVAVGECMTYSVGFRAPTQNEMLVSFAQFLMQAENPDEFFRDDTSSLLKRDQAGHGALIREDREQLRALMKKAIDDESMFDRWVGAFLTEPRNFHDPNEDELDESGILALLHREPEVHKAEGGRYTYFESKGRIYFSVEGETLVVSPELSGLVRMLCEENTWPTEKILSFKASEGFSQILMHIWNQGYIRVD